MLVDSQDALPFTFNHHGGIIAGHQAAGRRKPITLPQRPVGAIENDLKAFETT